MLDRSLLARRLADLDLRLKITLTLAVGSLLIAATIALPALWFSGHQIVDRTTELLATEAEHQRQAIELRVASDLSIAESLAANSVTANALADSVGRDVYLVPLLRNQRLQLSGARLALTDFRGNILASSSEGPAESYADVPAFRRLMDRGEPQAFVSPAEGGDTGRMVALLPVVYRLSGTVEGAVALSVPLEHLVAGAGRDAYVYLTAPGRPHLAGEQPRVRVIEDRTRLQLPAPLQALAIEHVLARDRSSTLGVLNLMVGIVAVVGATMIVVVVLFSRRAARWLATPLWELAAASEDIAATGRFQRLPETERRDEYGRLTQAFNQMVDRLERLHAELEERVAERTRALAYSEARLRYVMDATGEGLWDWDLRNNRVTHNRRWLQLLGVDDHYREHDFETFAVLLHPDDRPAVEAAVEASVANDETFSHEHRMVRPDGEVIWVLDRGKVVERDIDGQPLRMVGSLLDITDRRQATEQLRVRELYLRATLDNLPFLFWLKDTESRFLTVNRQFAMACGRGEPERVVGLTDLDVWPRDLAEAYRADDREVMAGRREKAVEEPVETEGERRWIETYKKPVVADDGTLFGTVGFARDITERKEMEHELAQSQQRWHLAVSGTKDGIWDWNVATGEMYFSPRWKEMLGFREDELDDRFEVWESLIHPDDLPGVRAALERHLRGETEYFQAEFRMHTRDGAGLWILSRGRALFDQAGAPIRMSGSHTDISDRRLAEAAIRERTEQLDAIFSLSPDGFVAFDAERRVRYVNPAFVHMTGFAEAEVIGMGEADFSAALIENVRPSIDFTGIDALRTDAAERGGISRAVLLELQRAPRTVLQMGLGVSHSETVSQILYFRDVTRETEVDQMKSEFLSTAAHELRTPMASILGFSELLLNDGFDEGTRRELLQTVHTQSELMASILNELLDLARIEARKGKDFVLEPLQLGDLLFEAVASYLAPPGRELPVLEKGDADVTLLADRTKLLQVVGNVLSNAYKYSPGGGEVTVRLLPPRERDGHRTAGFSVTDRGIGMSPEQLARVCERFYRADTSGQIPGTGLGMSIVKEIVELHQGNVEVESAPGRGTAVTVWLKATVD